MGGLVHLTLAEGFAASGLPKVFLLRLVNDVGDSFCFLMAAVPCLDDHQSNMVQQAKMVCIYIYIYRCVSPYISSYHVRKERKLFYFEVGPMFDPFRTSRCR